MKKNILIIILILLFTNCKTVKNSDRISALNIHFIDDFDNNLLTLKIDGKTVLDDKLFRKSSAPQLRSRHPIYLIVSENSIKFFEKGKLKNELNLKKNELIFPSELQISTKDTIVSRMVDPKKNKQILISYNNGNIEVNQANGI